MPSIPALARYLVEHFTPEEWGGIYRDPSKFRLHVVPEAHKEEYVATDRFEGRLDCQPRSPWVLFQVPPVPFLTNMLVGKKTVKLAALNEELARQAVELSLNFDSLLQSLSESQQSGNLRLRRLQHVLVNVRVSIIDWYSTRDYERYRAYAGPFPLAQIFPHNVLQKAVEQTK